MVVAGAEVVGAVDAVEAVQPFEVRVQLFGGDVRAEFT